MKIETAIMKKIIEVPSDFGPVGMKLENGILGIHNFSNSDREQLHVDFEFGEKSNEKLNLNLNSETFQKILKKFGKSKEIEIKTEGNIVIITDDAGNEVKYTMLAADEVKTIDPMNMPKLQDDVLILPSKVDNNGNPIREKVSTIVRGVLDDIKSAFGDMELSGADYYTLFLKPNKAYSMSGHWSAKSLKSKSPLGIKVEGKEAEFTGDDVLRDILKSINGAFEIQVGTTMRGTIMARIIDKENENSFKRSWVITSVIRTE